MFNKSRYNQSFRLIKALVCYITMMVVMYDHINTPPSICTDAKIFGIALLGVI